MDRVPLVSVVIPCYNGMPWVPHAVRSALRQTYPNVEVIVVDDGSVDGSRAVIEAEFGDAVTVVGIANSGPGAARNVGFESAGGEYVQFLDADDIITTEKIERSMACFRDHPETDIVYTALHEPAAYDFVDESQFPAAEFQRTVDLMAKNAYEYHFRGTGMPSLATAQPLYRSRLLREHGAFDETLVLLEDVELLCRQIFNGARIRDVAMVGILYRDHPGDRLTNKLRYDYEAYYHAAVKLIELARTHGRMSGAIKDFAMMFLIWEAALECVRKRNYRNAAKYVALAGEICPRLPGPAVFRGIARVIGTVPALTAARVVLDNFVRFFPARARSLLGPAAVEVTLAHQRSQGRPRQPTG
ncbi:glycosyltransferase family 2 protein [Actinophytocola sediminis]